MNLFLRGSIIGLMAAGLVACGGGTDSGDGGGGAGNGESGGSASTGGGSGYTTASFVGSWTVDSADVEQQVDKLIEQQLAEVPEAERAMAEGMVAMMRPMMTQMMSGITMTLNADGTASASLPGDNPGDEMKQTVGEWKFEDGLVKIGFPDEDNPEAGLDWANAEVVSDTVINLTPPMDEDGPDFTLKMNKSEG